MSKKDELMNVFRADLKNHFSVSIDENLLFKVVTACGPSIYNRDASTVSAADPDELNTVKQNFLIKKLGLADNENLDKGLALVLNQYGKSNPRKLRAVVYYMLTKYFQKESAL